MTDYFDLLGEQRRPWLDAEHLKAKFLSLSANFHPDHVRNPDEGEKSAGAPRFADLNTAYNCLREAKSRTRHLLELELGHEAEKVSEIPPDLANLFIEVAQVCREAGDYLVERSKTCSPLLRVQLFERGQELADRLQMLRLQLSQRQEAPTRDLKSLDAEWGRTMSDSTARPLALQRLEEIHRRLSFYGRWDSQLREAIIQLTL